MEAPPHWGICVSGVSGGVERVLTNTALALDYSSLPRLE